MGHRIELWSTVHNELESRRGIHKGTFYPWNNESERSALTLLVQSETTLFMLEDLDMAHANKLAIIGKVGESPSAFYQITQTQRVSFSTHLRALGDKILYAYYLNNTSTSNGVG